MSNEYDLSRAFKKIENELIDSMMRNLERHKAEEDEEGFNWEQWQALQLKDLERYRAQNKDKFQGRFADLNKRIEDLYRQTYGDAKTAQEQYLLEQIKKKDFTPTQTKDTQFFNINDDKLNILIERTKADFTRAEYAVLRKADDDYRKIIFDAQVYGNVTNDYNKAVDMATEDFLKKGIQSIQYKNGAKHNIESYARMAIRTGNKRAYLMGEGSARDEYGVHTVQVNKRTQACPKCVGYLGKVLVDDVYSGGTIKEAVKAGVPTLSQAMAQGFLHPNCKDIYSTYLEGVSKPAEPWTKDEIEEIVGDYNSEQALQHANEMKDSYQRMAKYALDPDNKARYQQRADIWEQRADIIKLTERRKQRMTGRKIQPLPRSSSVDISSMPSTQLKEYATNNLKTEFVGIEGANADFVREAVKVIDEFERKMGGNSIEGLRVQFGGLPKGVYAKYDDKTKTLHLKKTGNIEKFVESQKKANERYKRKWKTDKDYYATETFSGTILHELGHAVDVDVGQALSKSLSANSTIDELSVKVSAYAGSTQSVRATKRSEAWAENFSAYMDGGKNRANVPKEIADKIEGYFESKRANQR